MRWLDGIMDSVDRDSEGQGSLACCSPWGHTESDTTQQLNNNNFKHLPWLGPILGSEEAILKNLS